MQQTSLLIEHIRQELSARADSSNQSSVQRFFKEPIKTYGIKIPVVKSLIRNTTKELKPENKKFVFELCETLWQSGYLEESIIACEWAYSQRKKFEPDDFKLFEKWIYTYVNNWASCDTFCNHTVGEFLLLYPGYTKHLKSWAADGNRWVRRAAAVSLIIPARKGKFLDTVLEIAQLQLHDPDDLVQKGYGWMLKSAGKPHEETIFNFIMTHKATMPRTALRYAIENMPAELKEAAMAK